LSRATYMQHKMASFRIPFRHYEIRIENFLQLYEKSCQTKEMDDGAKILSKPFYNFTKKHHLMYTPCGMRLCNFRFFGIYLCVNTSGQRPFNIQYGFILRNEKDVARDYSVTEEMETHCFDSDSIFQKPNVFGMLDWGFTCFIELEQLLDPANGFIHVDGSIRIDIKIFDPVVENERKKVHIILWSLWKHLILILNLNERKHMPFYGIYGNEVNASIGYF
jgi:hypothetical protein